MMTTVSVHCKMLTYVLNINIVFAGNIHSGLTYSYVLKKTLNVYYLQNLQIVFTIVCICSSLLKSLLLFFFVAIYKNTAIVFFLCNDYYVHRYSIISVVKANVTQIDFLHIIHRIFFVVFY